MTEPSGYDVASYGEMIDCEPRMSVYAQALKRAITPGCTVMDIGASFGAFSFLACKYGAGSVIAIEPDPSVELIMPMAEANGCADRIKVVRGLSTEYQPEAPVDVIISDVRGTMPLYENHIETIVDARQRLLKPGGHQLPIRDTIRMALVRSPKMYRTCEKPWVSNDYDLDLSLGKSFAVNDYYRANLDKRALLSQPSDLASLDYRTITDPNLDATTELVANKAGVVHGLLMWFDAEIADGLRYSNGPGEPPLVYGQKF
ncbi:MAG: class I SAM-dependent methyltransferase, partial [Pseudomonadota bacterium]